MCALQMLLAIYSWLYRSDCDLRQLASYSYAASDLVTNLVSYDQSIINLRMTLTKCTIYNCIGHGSHEVRNTVATTVSL